MTYDFDLFVIGAGSGGVRAARMAASYGAKVAIAEEYRIGGTCVIRGCVPKKFLVYASEFTHNFTEIAPSYGWSIGDISFDWKTLRNKVQDEVARLSAIYNRNLGNSGVEIFETRAEILDKNHIKLSDGRVLSAKYILIATGGAPYIPDEIIGSEHAISSNEVFLLDKLPKSIVINGGGFIAIEFAFVLKGLGVDVTLVYRGEEILRSFDDCIRAEVHENMKNRGIRVITKANINEISPIDDGFNVHLSNGEIIFAGKVLLALGRKPYVKGLGLENAGVEIENDAIKVDEYSKTNIDNIYAVGDVTNRINLTPVAIREGAAFAATIFNNKPTKMNYENVASAVFSQPPVGTVGLTEHDARAKFGQIDVYRTRFRPMRIALSNDQTRVMMKLVVRASDNIVVGVHIVGDDAPEMIQMAAIAVKAGLTKEQFDETCAVHPTMAEELVTLK
ncbi:glutathione-disulfide reductase [Pseudaquidulcibacter saccharophilus]|uniref:glutathione-disulfide reductase n=1 Tax=Pseudaquidulcibacter saccharophilus TaxID=2831900 RepID=UPI001EFF4E01|nr:glutathione-disulfide reductase [Pseudaquidulcibacter saccharophilus]